MPFLRSAAAALLVCTTLSLGMAQAMAEGASPLPAGKPAGTREAAMSSRGLGILLGLGAIIAFTVMIATTDNNKGVTTPTTATGTGA